MPGLFDPYWDFLYGGESIRNGYWFRNVSGNALASVAEDDTIYYPPIPAGVYQFTFSSSTECTLSYILPDDNGNPLMAGQTITVTNDGSTEHTNMIMGFKVIVSPLVAAGDVAQIGIGCKLTSEGYFQRILNMGVALENTIGGSVALSVQNLTGDDCSGCKICVRNGILIANSRFDDAQGGPIQNYLTADVQNQPADADNTGTTLSLDAVNTGPPITVDMLYEEDSPIVTSYTGTNYPYAKSVPVDTWLLCEALHIGRTSVDGVFKFVDVPLVTDEATIYHTDGGSCVEISVDGSTYASNGELLDLTEDGQATGVVTADGTVDIYLRVNVPSGVVDRWQGWRCFDIAVIDDTNATEVITGSVFVVAMDSEGSLAVRVTSYKEQYDRPRFTKVGLTYVADPAGLYVESLTAPGTYILRTADPALGLYSSYESILAANGVTIA